MEIINRRRFLRDGALGLTAVSLAAQWQGRAAADPRGLPVGLELYTVRKEMDKDFEGTLRAVAAIGYQEVELHKFFNKSAAQLRDALGAAGLSCPAGHY